MLSWQSPGRCGAELLRLTNTQKISKKRRMPGKELLETKHFGTPLPPTSHPREQKSTPPPQFRNPPPPNISDVGLVHRLCCRRPLPEESVAERLLMSFRRKCVPWRERPQAVAKGSFAPPSITPREVAQLPREWSGWSRWRAAFTWRDASSDETEGEAFSRYCCRSNPHLYAQVDGKWFHKSSELVRDPMSLLRGPDDPGDLVVE